MLPGGHLDNASAPPCSAHQDEGCLQMRQRAGISASVAGAADVPFDVKGDAESKDLDLTTASVDHIIVLGAGAPLHAAAHGVAFGEFECVRFRIRVGFPSRCWRPFGSALAPTARFFVI
jgi:hypothetical protein